MSALSARPLSTKKRVAAMPRSGAKAPVSRQRALPLRGTIPAAASQEGVVPRSSHPWLALTALGFGAFVVILDTSMVNVTLPTLQQSWLTDLPSVSWVLHLYNLLLATCLIPAGRLADLFGRKRMTLLGLLLFTAGSILCGLSSSLVWLLGARAAQAVGGAFVSALGFALVQELFPKHQCRLALGLFGSLNAVAAAIGPFIGGLLVPLFGWRSIFFVNVPFCLAGLLSVRCFVAERKARASNAQLDGWGLLVLLLALVSLVLSIIEGSAWGWTSPAILALFEGAGLGLALFEAYPGDFLEELIEKFPDEFGPWVREPVTRYRDCYLDALWVLASHEDALGQHFFDDSLSTEQRGERRRLHQGKAAQLYYEYALFAINSRVDSKLKFAHRAGKDGERVIMSQRAIRRCVVLLGMMGKTEMIDQVYLTYKDKMSLLSEGQWKPDKETESVVMKAKGQLHVVRFFA